MKNKEFDYSDVKEGIGYQLLKPLMYLTRDINFRVKYVGTENIPESGGYILASNHVETFDPFVVGLGIKHRQLHFMSKKENFDNFIFSYLLPILNAFPIDREKTDLKGLRYACKILEKGYILAIFPEGTRSKTGEPGEAKRGIATIAARTKSDILPAAICNSDGFKRHSVSTVRYGKVIKYEELGLSARPTKDELSAAADYIMQKINELNDSSK